VASGVASKLGDLFRSAAAPRVWLRRYLPVAATGVSVALVATFLPSLPTANPYVAGAGGGNGGTVAVLPSPSASAATPSPGASVSPGQTVVSPTGQAVITSGAPSTSHSNPYIASGTNCNTWQGVTCDKVVTSSYWFGQPCGQDISGFLALLGVNADPQTDLNVLIPYFNDHAKDIYPAQYASALQNGFWGRKLSEVGASGASTQHSNDGGPFCPDTNKQTATDIATSDKAFAALGGCLTCGSEGEGDVIQPNLASYHVLNIAGTSNRTSWYTDPAQYPYSWGLQASGDQDVNELVGLVCNWAVGHPDTVTGKPRVFAVTNINLPQENNMGDELVSRIQACGANVPDHIRYEKDTTTAQQQARAIRAKEQTDGVTSVICLCDAIALIVGAINDNTPNPTPYIHEWFLSDFEFGSTSATGETISGLAKQEWQHVFSAAYYPYHTWATAPNYCATWWGKIWCNPKYNPNCANGPTCPEGKNQPGQGTVPDDFENWAYIVYEYGAMLIAAGPDLTPANVTNGMFKLHPAPPIPGDDPYAVTLGFGPSYPYAPLTPEKDFEVARFDPNQSSPYLADIVDPNKGGGKGAFVPLLPDLGWGRWYSWGRPL